MNALDRLSSKAVTPPRVSAITIFFNEEDYLAEAIESVLGQDAEDFELILVDDGSTDDSPEIARSYSKQYPGRIRYLKHRDGANRGMSASRNLGLRDARGEYVAFLDADDRWHPSKLREQMALLDRMGSVDAVGGMVNYWASHAGGTDRLVPTAHVRNRPIQPSEASLRLYPLGKAHAPSMSDLMFRRKAVAAVGGFEEAFSGAYEDQAFLAKFYLNSTLYITDKVWSDYRLHERSCMAKVRRNGSYGDARLAFLNWFERHLVHSERLDRQVHRALHRALGNARKASIRSRLAATPLGSVVRTGKAMLRRLRPMLLPAPAILMYHRVAEETFDPWELSVSPSNFEDHLRWIARNRTVLSLTEFAEKQRSRSLPRDAIALTFDDGYACNAEAAVPLLERFEMPATIFLSTGHIHTGEEFWWDELETLVLRYGGRTLRIEGHEIDVGEPDADDGNWAPGAPPKTRRQSAYRRIWSILYPMSPPDLSRAIASLREQCGGISLPRQTHRPMTSNEVRAAKSDMIDFGSHACSHASLPMLDERTRRHEIRNSIDACSALTGHPPACFAYPYGDVDEESADLVDAAGFACACKADGGFITRKSGRFALPRILAGNWTSAELARRLGRP